eukprot:Hpha_TRINITY_DN13856_c0_g1::TRINITY_DN13856_c0_g1_i1::g.69662::m.69662
MSNRVVAAIIVMLGTAAVGSAVWARSHALAKGRETKQGGQAAVSSSTLPSGGAAAASPPLSNSGGASAKSVFVPPMNPQEALVIVRETTPNNTLQLDAKFEAANLPRSPDTVLRPHHFPYKQYPVNRFVKGDCHNCTSGDDCTGHFCAPVAWRQWSDDLKVIPVSYSLPLANFVTEIPTKDQNSASGVPGLKFTGQRYFDNETDYLGDYSRSYYCLTFKKGGWHALRHLEIIAAGCMPYFVDLESAPEDTLVHLPKQLLLEARDLPGVYFDCLKATVVIDHSVFPRDRYFSLLRQLIDHGRRELSSESMARYALARAGKAEAKSVAIITDWNAPEAPGCRSRWHFSLPKRKCKKVGGGVRCPPVRPIGPPPKREIPPECLGPTKGWPWMNCDCGSNGAPLKAQGSYLTWTLTHGLRSLLGKNAVDSSAVPFLYDTGPSNAHANADMKSKISAVLYGHGFGYAWRIPDNITINRTKMEERLRNKEFDAVFVFDRSSRLAGVADEAYGGEVIYSQDDDVLAQFGPKGMPKRGYTLLREVPDCLWYRPPLDRRQEAIKRCIDYKISKRSAGRGCFSDSLVGLLIGSKSPLRVRNETTRDPWWKP